MTLLFCLFARQEEQKELDEITAKRQKKGRNEEEAPAEEKTVLHGNLDVLRLGIDVLFCDKKHSTIILWRFRFIVKLSCTDQFTFFVQSCICGTT